MLNIHKLRETLTDVEIFKAISELDIKQQEELLEDFHFWARPNQILPKDHKGLGYLVLSGRGYGKLLSKHEQIHTLTKGLIPFGNLEIGDKVFDEQGLPCNVTAIYQPKKEESGRIVELSFSTGEVLTTCTDHLWVTWTHRDRKQYLRYKDNEFPPKDWVNFKGKLYNRYGETEETYGPKVRTTQEIIDTFTIGTRGDTNHCIPLAAPLGLEKQELPIDPYLYGYWLGDGTVKTGAFTLHVSDLDSFCRHLDKLGYSYSVRNRADKPSTYTVTAFKLRKQLMKLGLELKENIPDVYRYSSYEDRLALLRGLLDSDGGVSKTTVEFSAKRKHHADLVEYLMASLGQKVTYSINDAKLYEKLCGKRHRVRCLPTVNLFHLERKAEQCEEILARNASQKSVTKHRMITGYQYKEWDDSVGYQCITVDSPNSMYLIGNSLIPTHNTYTGANWVIQRAKDGYGPIALIGQTVADVRDTMVESGSSSILAQAPKNFKPLYEPSKRRLTFPNGVICTTFSGDSPEQLRGSNNASAWVDELCKFEEPEEMWTQMVLGLRISKDPKVLITTTPKPIPIIKRLYEDDNIFKVTGSTFENSANLSANFLAELKRKYEGTRLGRQEIEGHILWESEDALFSSQDINRNRVEALPLGDYTVAVGIDPAMTANKGSDETGIVVGAINNQTQHGYILGVFTGKYSPSQWATKLQALCESYSTNVIVAEVNAGGDMVTETIYQHTRGLVVVPVRATKGKVLRAEPIALLSEQGRLHIVGHLEKLEDEMITYDGTGKSPDSLDAMVWVMTHLMLGKRRLVKSNEFLI